MVQAKVYQGRERSEMAKVLIVDDDAISALSISMLLEEGGHNVDSAGSVEQALEVVKHFEPDVLVTDLRLQSQKQGGVTIAKSLLLGNPSLRVIMYSGASPEEVQSVMSELPECTFLKKPIEPSLISKAIAGEQV